MPHDHDLRVALAASHADAHAWAVRCSGGDTEEADDLLQEVYLLVLAGRAVFGGRSTFRTWLYGVIRRAGLARRRRLWVRRALLQRRHDDLRPAAPASPDEAVEAADEVARLQDALSRLSHRQQDLLTLVFYHDLTIEEAAGVLAIPVGTARTHYARGKARLEGMLHAR